MNQKVIITCALNGVLTDPQTHPVPFRPREMADSARDAYNAGAAVVHIHFREQARGRFPCWEPDLAAECVDAIRDAAPGMLINSTTGVVGADISGPLGVIERIRPEMAALNAGSLNYLKVRKNGAWAWPPMLFDNPVAKVEGFLKAMKALDIVPECECFDTGIVRAVKMYAQNGMLTGPYTVSLVQGVASGMPARADLLPILVDLLPQDAHWQSVVIGRAEVWDIHRRTAELGGHLRTGVEDTFYLPDGQKVGRGGNGQLIEAISALAREVGREPATPKEALAMIQSGC